MPSVLPTESTLPKQVDTWGIGTYDSQRDEEGDHGENSEGHEPAGRSLPDDATKSPQTNAPEEWLSYPNEPESRTVTNLVSAELLKPNRKSPMPRGDVPPEEDIDEGSLEVFGPDRDLGYPDGADARLGTVWLNGFVATALVPGDPDGNFQHFHPKTEIYDARVESSAGEEKSILPQEQGVDGRDPGSMGPKRKKTSGPSSELPSDGDNPSARADYYDYMHPVHTGANPAEKVRLRKQERPDLYCPKCLWMTGGGPCPRHGGPPWTKEREEAAREKSRQPRQAGFSDYVAPKEDSGAYAGKKKESEDSELPGVMKNEETMEDFLQPLGNWWQGKEIEDVSSPQGFPTTDFDENIKYDRSDNQDGGTTVPLGDPKMFASGRPSMTTRQATNINQVMTLTKDFLKEAGKEDITKRHVLAFLQSRNLPQYLSSDIIRCLKLSHDVHIKDVLDEFPVARKASASNTTIAKIRRVLIALECKHVLQPEVASVLRRCAANLTRALIDMDRLATDVQKEAEKCYDDHVKESTKTAYEAYCKSCQESGQHCLSHDEWLKGLKPADGPGEPTSQPH